MASVVVSTSPPYRRALLPSPSGDRDCWLHSSGLAVARLPLKGGHESPCWGVYHFRSGVLVAAGSQWGQFSARAALTRLLEVAPEFGFTWLDDGMDIRVHLNLQPITTQRLYRERIAAIEGRR